MPLKIIDWYTRGLIRATPNQFYIFGDNLAMAGYGGQAKEARNEPNSIGIPTKRYPGRKDEDYLADSDLAHWRIVAAPSMARVLKELGRGAIVNMPADGIGTGLAKLKARAPLIWDELQAWISELDKYRE